MTFMGAIRQMNYVGPIKKGNITGMTIAKKGIILSLKSKSGNELTRRVSARRAGFLLLDLLGKEPQETDKVELKEQAGDEAKPITRENFIEAILKKNDIGSNNDFGLSNKGKAAAIAVISALTTLTVDITKPASDPLARVMAETEDRPTSLIFSDPQLFYAVAALLVGSVAYALIDMIRGLNLDSRFDRLKEGK